MKTMRLLSLCLVGGALTLTACPKDDASPGAETTATDTDPSTSDTDDDTETSGPGTTFGTDSATTDPTDTDSDSATTDDSNTTIFVPEGDIAGVSECDPWAQDCPEGEKCVAYGSTGGGWDANKCVPILGDGQLGDPCTYDGTAASTDTCDAGLWCWNVNEEGQGVCTAFCTGTPDDPLCDPGYGCSIANEGSIILCLLNCDPLLQDCPVEGDWCFYDFSGNFVCAFGTQDLPAGEPCGFINDCVGGNVCLGAEVLPACNGASCCVPFCDLSDPQCSIDGTECAPFFEEGQAPPEFVDVGVCIVPGA